MAKVTGPEIRTRERVAVADASARLAMILVLVGGSCSSSGQRGTKALSQHSKSRLGMRTHSLGRDSGFR